jgi:hypothetical protein
LKRTLSLHAPHLPLTAPMSKQEQNSMNGERIVQ